MKHAVVTIILMLMSVSLGVFGEEENMSKEREAALLNRIDQLEARLAKLEGKLVAQEEKLEEKTARVEQSNPNSLTSSWKNGLVFESESGDFKLKVGGRIHTDMAFFDQSRELARIFGDEDDAAEIRRARINFEGTAYHDFLYRMEFDFAGDGGEARFKDVYAGLKNIPWIGMLKLGHFREPYGMETLLCPDYMTFMERSVSDAFSPSRNLGLMAQRTWCNKRIQGAAGLFKEVDDFPGPNDADEDQGYAFTTRLTGLPFYKEEGKKLLHLGIAYSHRNPDGAVIGYKTRPEAHLAQTYLNTERYQGFRFADASMDDVDLFGLEALWIHGPLSLQGEYSQSRVESTFDGEDHFDGFYLHASYFLTGEHRSYKQESGLPGRVIPRRNFSLRDGGWGAWQVALRYSSIDLNSGMIRGGEEENWTLGLNWYLNPNTRFMVNYEMASITHDLYRGDLDVLQTRLQIDF